MVFASRGRYSGSPDFGMLFQRLLQHTLIRTGLWSKAACFEILMINGRLPLISNSSALRSKGCFSVFSFRGPLKLCAEPLGIVYVVETNPEHANLKLVDAPRFEEYVPGGYG